MSLQLTDGSGRGTGVPLALNKEKCRKQELRASGQGHGSWTTHDILQGHTRCGGARRRGACPTWAHRGRLGAQESRVWSGVWRQCGSPRGQGGGGQGPSARAPADGDAGPEAAWGPHFQTTPPLFSRPPSLARTTWAAGGPGSRDGPGGSRKLPGPSRAGYPGSPTESSSSRRLGARRRHLQGPEACGGAALGQS